MSGVTLMKFVLNSGSRPCVCGNVNGSEFVSRAILELISKILPHENKETTELYKA